MEPDLIRDDVGEPDFVPSHRSGYAQATGLVCSTVAVASKPETLNYRRG